MSLLFSSLLSLVIGTVVGLTQSRIKRLYAFSTISHVGFILLGLSIHSIESIQAFMFYLMQYSISNLNAFFLIITIGYSLYFYVYKIKDNVDSKESIIELDTNKSNDTKAAITNIKSESDSSKSSSYDTKQENSNLQDINNSPLQLISQLKGYYYINPLLSLSLSITLFSFIGVPPLIGFFGKQMILSSALDSGYVLMSLVAILTSVISAVYYLVIIKQMFFDKPDYIINPELNDFNATGLIVEKNTIVEKVQIKTPNIVISSSLSLPISILTLIIGLFIFIPQE
jgi:NADH-ubiquinone oxidoreductase chain 2